GSEIKTDLVVPEIVPCSESGVCIGRGDTVDSRHVRRWAAFLLPPLCLMVDSLYRLFRANTEGDVLVLTLTEKQVEGDAIAQALQRELLAAGTEADARKVVVDFQNVHYISSVAFSPLLALRRHLNGQKGRLVVCGLNTMVGDIFYTTKMVSPTGTFGAPFEMQPDVPAAVAALTTPAQAPGA